MSSNQKLRRAENRDKRLRFSIRKFNVGVASVAVAAFFMVNGSSVSADSIETTAVDTVETVETAEESPAPSDEDPEPVLVQEEVTQELAEEEVSAVEEVTEESVEEAVAPVSEEATEVAEEETADKAAEENDVEEAEKSEEKSVESVATPTITERAVIETPARVATTTYRVRYVDEETGQVVYQRNYTASEETTDAEEVAHEFKVTVALELDSQETLADYVLTDNQEVAVRDNAIEAIVTERGTNRILVNVRRDTVAANNNSEEESFTKLAAQNVNKGGITNKLSERVYADHYEPVVWLDDYGQIPVVYVTGDGLGLDRITYLGNDADRQAAINLWRSGVTTNYFNSNPGYVFSGANNPNGTGRGYDYTQNPMAGNNIAQQLLMVQNGYGYEMGVDDVYVDFSEYIVVADEYARQGYTAGIVGIRTSNIPTGLTYDYNTGVLSGKVEAGIENGANYISLQVALFDPQGNEVKRATDVSKWNIVYQDQTPPEIEVTDIYSAVANENLKVQMVYPTEAEQEAARQAYERGESEFYFNVKDNGWALPYGTVVRDAEGKTINAVGKQSYNEYYGRSNTATTVVSQGFDKNSVLSVDLDLKLENEDIQANNYDIYYDYEDGTLNVQSNVAGIYTVTVTSNDYKFSQEMQGTTLGPWDHVTSPQETTAQFTLHILPTVEISNADTASDTLDVTVAAGSTKSTITLPDGTDYQIELVDGVWQDQDGNVLTYTIEPGTEKITVTLPVDYHGLTEVGNDVIRATVETEDGLVNVGTGNVTNTPPVVETKGGVEQVGKTIDLLDPAYVTGISDNEDDRHDNPTPDDKVTTVTRVVVTDPNGQVQIYEAASIDEVPQVLDIIGDYQVTVTVTDSDGATNDNSYTITVNPLQKAIVNYLVQDYYDAYIDEATGNIIDAETGRTVPGVRNNGDGTYTAGGDTYVLRQDGQAIVTPGGDVFLISKASSTALLHTDELYGQNGESIPDVMRDPETGVELGTNYTTEDIIASYLAKGYELIDDGFTNSESLHYDTNTAVDQVYNVYLRERIVEIPLGVKPGDLVEPGDPNSPEYPDTVEGVKTAEEVTRTIHYRYERDNSEAAPDTVETLKFDRSVYVNLVTGEIIDGSWNAENDDWTFDDVEAPRVIGYKEENQTIYTGTRSHIPERVLTEADINMADFEEYIYYSAGNNTAFVKYIDIVNGEILIGKDRHTELDKTVKQAYEEEYHQNPDRENYDPNWTYTGPDADLYIIDIDSEELSVSREEHTANWTGLLLRGDSDEPINYSTQDTLNSLYKQGYELVKDPLTEGQAARTAAGYLAGTEVPEQQKEYAFYTPSTVDYQLYEIQLGHRRETITPNDNPIPGEPVDPNDPNSPNWPPTVENITKQLVENVTRVINYVDEDGKVIATKVEQEANFERNVVVDLVTGELEFQPWSEAQELEEVKSPVVSGYITETVKVDSETVNAEDKDIEEIVVYKKLGSYVINTPGVATPSEVYPNDDNNEDPSTTGTPTTVVPYVPGYTPRTEDGQPLTPVDPADPSKGYEVPAIPEDPTKDTVINYIGNVQDADINYILQNPSGQEKTREVEDVTGLSGAVVDYDTTPSITDYIKQGYELVSDAFTAAKEKGEAVYDDDETVDQSWDVVLKERVIPITEDAVPGQPVDPTDPNSPVWPETITSITKKRTIYYVYEDGTTAATTVVQPVTFYGNVNLVTGEITYDEFTKGLVEVKSPVIEGYFATDPSMPATGLRYNSNDIEETVIYRPFGSYVFEIPSSRPQKDSEVYPNDPEDASRPGQVTTVAPVVDGYTPYIPYTDNSNHYRDVNGNPIPLIDPTNPSKGYTLNLVDSTDPSKGYVVPFLPANLSQDTIITYIGNDQKATIKFVAKSTNASLADDVTAIGPSNALVGATTATGSELTVDKLVTDTLTNLRRKGYYVSLPADNEYAVGEAKRFDEDDDKDQEFVIKLTKRSIIIVPDTPIEPGQPIDPTDPDSPVWPDVKEKIDELTAQTKRTVEYVDTTGKPIGVPAATKTADYERMVLIDLTTGEVVTEGTFVVDGVEYTIENGKVTIEGTEYTNGYSNWSVSDKSAVPASADASKATFPAEVTPIVLGYILTDASQNIARDLAAKEDKVDQVIYTPVGNVVINVPGNDEPTTDPYPNDPEDPTRIDTPTTPIPVVPGYVPVDEDGNELPKGEDGNYVVPNPEDPTKDTVINYKPVGQTARVDYVLVSSGEQTRKVDKTATVTGNPDEEIEYSTQPTISDYLKAGYELVSDEFKPGTTFDSTEDVDGQEPSQVFTVTLKERVEPVDPTNPPKPGEPVDPTDPDSPVWPDEVKDLVTTEKVTRTITYVDKDGKEVSETVTETKTFTRPATVNLVTGEVVYGEWTPAQDFEEKVSPVVEGYLADKKSVPAATVNATDEDIKEQVVYTPVGKVIINIPEGSDVPTPDPDPYPNNPEDPTDIDDPTTPIPEVPGYVPVTEDGTELPKDEDGNYVPPTPTDPTKDTIINYVEADQRAIFNYVLIDEAGNSKLDSSASVPGKTEAPITYSTAAKIADYLKAGYELVSDAVDANGNPYVAGTTAFDNDETVDQVFTVTLKERVIPVDPTDPDAPKPVPGEPVDPTDPNSPVWPDTVKDLVTTEEVTRTITYVDENGKEVSETVTETKTFTRTADINLVTGVITYGDWTPAQDFAEKVSPVVDGYIADKKAVPAATVNATDEDIKEVVTYKPLGQWIPNLPETEDPIDPIVYPNDPEDPTVPGTETPVVPYVPGYTPVDPEGNPLPPVDPEDPTKGYDVPEVPEDPTKDTVINYVANPQQATVTYVDTTGKELVPVVELSGKTDEVIDYDTTPTIEDLIKKGYELVTDEFAAAKDENGNVVYDNDDDKDQNFVVTLKERVVEVPKDAQPGQPVDPTDPNSPVWPDDIEDILKKNGQETVTRTITYVDENGVEVSTKVTQTVEYTRPVYVNLVTGDVDSVGEWTTDKSDLDEVISPVIDGMTADKLTVDKVATTPTTEDINEVVTYTANAVQTAVIVYEFKDADGKPSKGQETVIDPVTGRGSTPIEYTTEDRIAEFIKKGYDLVKDEFIPGTLFDEDDDVTQRFVVSFVERVVPVDPENPPVPGQPVDPTDPNSPVWPDTVNDIYFERTVTRTITYVDDKGNEVSETVTEEVTFSREATVNLVTGEIVYSDWSPAQSFDAKTSPVVKGYLADKATVPAVTVTGDSNDINEVVVYKPVGKVIIEVPGQDEPITDPYPNDPEDPTTIDKPTTPIPDVPGYTPVIVDPEDPTNPKPVPTDENGKPVIPVPTDPTKDTEIVYVANDQKAVFNFVDESGKIVANPISVDGKSNEEIKDPSAPTIAELEKAGYVVVSNDFVSGTKFDTDDAVDQHFTVTVKPRIETVDPKDPDAPKPVPGQPVDPTDPNSPVWPDTVENLETTKEITRTITYVDDKGNTVSETVTETVTFTRPVTINLVTGEVTYGEWTSDNATYPEVKSPVVPGYLADKPVVSEQTVTSDSDDITEVVTYKPVGKVIIEVPGQDEPITDPYPNDPEDPTKIDQPTTPIPVIPGYTPVIVNPEDPANPTPVPTDENGKPVVPVPADPTKDTEIVYVADDQKAVFNFVDESGKVVANPIAVDGKSDTVIVDPSAPTIAELEKAGYEVVAKDFVDGTKFDKDASVDQHFTVTVKPRIETVDPNDPNAPKPVPGQPVDPTDPNSPVWPDTVKDLETTKEITRTITYVDKDGKTVSESVTDKVTFTRPVTINLVTGEVTYGEWTTTNPTYPGVDSPIVPGYLADKPVVDASTVTADASSTTVVVTYTPVGNVVIEVPGQDQPSVDPYPNHPTDPTTIDQPTTPIPVVPGYTPVIVDPTDPTKLTPVPVDDKGNYIIPTPENPTQDTTIRYVANDQKVVFNFVDENGQVVATPILVEGKSDTVIVDPTATTIAELEKAGYVVVSTDFVSGTKFDKDSAVDQSFTIVVTPRIEPVGPNTPTPVPGQPVDPTDPNSPVWPDTVKDLETTKEITRTITYVDKNGNTVSETVVNKVTFTRDAKVNLVTGEITYGEWTTTDATYPEVKSPVVKGHIADKSVVTGTPVTPDTISSTEVVTYTPVGNVVIEVPGQDQPTVDPYPNHPTDPTAIDQPTTPIPVIPGYIAVDENGKELPKDEDGNYIVPSPEDPTKDTVIRYVKVDEPAKPAKPAEPAKPAPAPQAETPAPVVEEAPQLPNTGETNDAALTALGLTSLLGAAAVGYRRRKTN